MLMLLVLLVPTFMALSIAARDILAAELHRRQTLCELEAQRVLRIPPSSSVHLCRMLWML